MSKTILIAEDHADIRSMTRYLLQSFGCGVIEARDGYEAVKQAKSLRPDLILMDIAMPVMNGITAAHLIRTADSCREIPIVAVTTYGGEYVDTEDDFGFDRVLQKPLQSEDIQSLIQDFLGVETVH
ncbi:MAG TPA: response regulator [Pyrinomonadaceae bacterium]|nr:response regulator [Pyrinomonadaceae bacterium]